MLSFPVSSFKFQVSSLDVQTIADLLALGGCPEDADLAAVLGLLCQAVNEGSLCLPLTPEAIATRLPGADRQAAGALVAAFLDKAGKDPFAALVAHPQGYRPLVLADGASGPLLYFHKYRQAEEILRAGLTRLAEATAPVLAGGQLLDHLGDPERVMRLADGRPLERDPAQEAAVAKVGQRSLTLISGGPGTGKTTLLVTLLRTLVRSGVSRQRIGLAAPTGRAARRLTEALAQGIATIRRPEPEDLDLVNLKGVTLHRLLRFSPSRNTFYYSRANPLALDVVIVDEVSMVDALLLAALVEAIDPAATRLVLVGDKDQLPSVEAGAALADLVAGNDLLPGMGLVQLPRSHRVGPGLAGLAAQVNAGRCPPPVSGNWDQALGQGPDSWTLVDPAGPAHWRQGLSRWTRALYLDPDPHGRPSFKDLVARAAQAEGEQDRHHWLGLLVGAIGAGRILTLTREGPYGCAGANAQVARLLCRELDPWADPDQGLFNGALIMVVRNDYARGLFNGDTGLILAGADGYRAWFAGAGGVAAFAPQTLPPWEPAFALTVHKSQGSEYDKVLLALSDDPAHPLMTREMLYTGITRARHSICVYGSAQALAAAAGRKIQRFSGLSRS